MVLLGGAYSTMDADATRSSVNPLWRTAFVYLVVVPYWTMQPWYYPDIGGAGGGAARAAMNEATKAWSPC